MSERPAAPPEGALITAALKRTRVSAREAARRANISDARWRQITSGYQTVSGTQVPVRAPAETLARMAHVVGLTPENLGAVGREDAADELREILQGERQQAGEAGDEDLTTAELIAKAEELMAKAHEYLRRARGETG